MWISGEWMKQCIIGHKHQVCMYSIMPQEVLEKVVLYIENRENYRFELLSSIEYSENAWMFIQQLLERAEVTDEDSVGYVGHGTKAILENIHEKYDTLYVLDDFIDWGADESYIDYFQWADEKNIIAEYSGIYNISAGDEQFDVVISPQLYMEKDVILAFKELNRVVKARGIICCTLTDSLILRLQNEFQINKEGINLDEGKLYWIMLKKIRTNK